MNYENLPNGKPHISFSEVKTWAECSYRHKLQHIDKVGLNLPSVHADFGTAVHSTCEHFLRTGEIDHKVFKQKLYDLWSEHMDIVPQQYTVKAFKQFAKEGLLILPEIKDWFNETFPGWKFIDAEHMLYEDVGNHPHAFKGYIDCIIHVPGKKDLYWLIDFKTTSWGWAASKKQDDLVKMQLVLYKNYWANKAKVNIKDVRCGFVLLKRTAKAGSKCELVPVSVGDVSINKSLSVVNNMIVSVKKGVAIKNRNSCRFCEFYQTPHCP